MMSSSRAVFISYASQDTVAAQRIADALRTTGVEVWFDRSELVGGDQWDAKIRDQIGSCGLFVPVISAATQARREGYFRLEWKRAAQRTHTMADHTPFLLPVVIDETRDTDALVPEEFRAVQWTRLPGGETSASFSERVKTLLDGPVAPSFQSVAERHSQGARPSAAHSCRSSAGRWITLAALFVVAITATFLATRTTEPSTRASPTPQTQNPKPNEPTSATSVAVLPFTNLSDDRANEYFSDGISEELLTVLQKLPGLQVAARASAFSFKGTNATAQEMGQKLGVAHLVEGSVQKAGRRVKITARLSHVTTGQELWSKTFPPLELTDVFSTQSEIAQAIVAELRGRLASDGVSAATKARTQTLVQAAQKGGTQNVEAHQLYLEAKFYMNQGTDESRSRATDAYRRATELDPKYALAWAAWSRLHSNRAASGELKGPLSQLIRESREMAERALALEPDLAEGYVARFSVQISYDFDWRGASRSANRALELAPSDTFSLIAASDLAIAFSQEERALELAARALTLDPLNFNSSYHLAWAQTLFRRWPEAEKRLRRILEANSATSGADYVLSWVMLLQGRPDEAAEIAERVSFEPMKLMALAVSRWAQVRKQDSNEALARLVEGFADGGAYNIAQVHAYRGESDLAFEWLERAFRQRDGGISFIRVDPFLQSLHADPRWPVFIRKVGLADDQLK